MRTYQYPRNPANEIQRRLPMGYTEDWRGTDHIVAAAVWWVQSKAIAQFRCTCGWRNRVHTIYADENTLVPAEAELHLELWHDEQAVTR